MNQPNQALIDEPYIMIRVIGGYNLLRGIRERKDTEETKQRDSQINLPLGHQDSMISYYNDKQQAERQDTSNKEDNDTSNSFIKTKNGQNQFNPFNLSVSIHTPTTHLFETQSQKTYDGRVIFEQSESSCLQSQIQGSSKEKTQSLSDLSAANRFIMHRRWKSSQPPNQVLSEKKIFLKDLSKYIMIDVMDCDCYMEKILMNTQVLPVEFFSIPINAGKKWKFWLRMNKYTEESNLLQSQDTKMSNLEIENEQGAVKLRSRTLYFPNIPIETNSNDITRVNVKNTADDQIQKLTGINSSNFDQYFDQIEEPQPFYLQTDFPFNEHNYSRQNGIPRHQSNQEALQNNISSRNQTESARKLSNNQGKGQAKDKDQQNKVFENIQNLDKNYAWIQLEIITMDIGSLLKLSAKLLSIEEIERAGQPNVFFYNIVITRNDGLTYLIKRRYKQFRELKSKLQKGIKKIEYVSFPGKSISKLTSLFSRKSYLHYYEQAQQRTEKLQFFLNYITDLDEVYKEESFIQFFTSGGQLDQEMVGSPKI